MRVKARPELRLVAAHLQPTLTQQGFELDHLQGREVLALGSGSCALSTTPTPAARLRPARAGRALRGEFDPEDAESDTDQGNARSRAG